MKKYLVILNMSYRSDWEAGIVNRNYFILQELIASQEFEKIVSVDFLPFSCKKIAKVLIQQKPFVKNAQTIYNNLTTRVDKDEKHEDLFHVCAIHQRSLKKIFQQLQIDPRGVLFWSYTPFESEIMKEYPDSFHIFDAVDNWTTHPVYANRVKELEQHYTEIREHADVIFTVSKQLVELFGEKAHCIPNGVDAKAFDVLPPQKDQSSDKTIGYHGIIQSRFDIELFTKVVQLRPEYRFEIVGPVWREREAEVDQLSAAYENVHVHGPASYTELPQIIAQWDAAFIPHTVDAFTASMNPMKIYEYLAAGKPIVSTPVAGVEEFKEYISVAHTPEDCARALDEALQNNSPQLIQQRRTAVASHTWKSRVRQMLSIVKK